MVAAQQSTPAAAPTAAVATVRGNCMGAAVLIIVEFALGMGVNLFVAVPRHTSLLPGIFSSTALAAHAIVGLLLLGAAAGALVRAIRARRAVAFTAVGLAAILVAAAAGSVFVTGQSNGASFAMALSAAVAMFCYLAAVFSLR